MVYCNLAEVEKIEQGKQQIEQERNEILIKENSQEVEQEEKVELHNK